MRSLRSLRICFTSNVACVKIVHKGSAFSRVTLRAWKPGFRSDYLLASSKENDDASLVVAVVADVIIKEPLKNLRMVEGETAKMQCKVKNPKNYPITWLRNGEEIKVPSDKLVFSTATLCVLQLANCFVHNVSTRLFSFHVLWK